MPKRDRGYSRNIFINCPYDKRFVPMLKAMMFTVILCGYEPRLASEKSDSLELRLNKIRNLIRQSKYTIHDLSRMKTSKPNDLPRFNMPFELGLDYGCRAYGNNQHRKKICLILAEKRKHIPGALSDLAGVDPLTHNSSPKQMVVRLRNWIRGNLTRKHLKSGSEMWNLYEDFQSHFTMAMEDNNFSKNDIEEMTPNEFMAYIKKWIKKGKII